MELNRMNLIWSVGASICPTLARHSLQIANIRGIFSTVGIFFALLLIWVAVFERDWTKESKPEFDGSDKPAPNRWKLNLTLWPITLMILIFLPTGIESAIGGWAATYVQRTQETISTTVTAGTCFWLGVLISRTLSSTVLLLKRSERFVLRQSLVCVAVGTGLLLVSKSALGILPAVFLIGFGLGPVYPLLLALALQYSEDSLIFFIAGLGSAFLPWLTGVVSGAAKSLHTGLFVPFAGAVLMLVLGMRLLARDAKQPLHRL
jgi:FHS family glucose/mannose:H+ symporter-like MFS transporter